MSNLSAPSIRRALLAWYAQSKRDLPWRRSSDPYSVWVSEIMLQQTRVAAMIPYYERFLERFPAVQDLARAPEDAVLSAWSGLGYYSRARNLHKAAIEIVSAGEFPHHYEGLRALPGVGAYTAAAIASIAFNLRHAAIDGNAMRVLSRLSAEPGDIGSAGTRKRLEDLGGDLLDPRQHGDFNQAMMELGATLCLPKAPDCPRCPLSQHCEAFRLGKPAEFPVKLAKARRLEVIETLYYVERGDDVLFWRRAENSKRLAGFWELPGPAHFRSVASAAPVGEFRHTIVNTTYKYSVVRAALATPPRDLVWLAKERFDEVPLSTTARKALRCVARSAD